MLLDDGVSDALVQFTELPTTLAAAELDADVVIVDGRIARVGPNEGDMVVEQVHARHILLRPNELQDDATVRQRLLDIRARVLKGENFAALATQYSKDPSAARGGDLGWFGKGRMVKPFEDAVLKTKVGQITGPVRTQFGWHLIQVTDRRDEDLSKERTRLTARQAMRERKLQARKANVEKSFLSSFAKRSRSSSPLSPQNCGSG